MRIGVEFSRDFRQLAREMARDLAVPITNAVAKAGVDLQLELRGQTRGSGLGERLARTWRLQVYPPGRFAYSPASVVFTKAPNTIRAFAEGTLITPSEDKFLAIPTPAAPRRGTDGKRINPSNWPGTGKYGRLRLIFVRTDLGLLVVDLPQRGTSLTWAAGARSRSSRAKLRAAATERDGERYVVMFWLVPQAKMPKRLDIDGAARAALDGLHADLRRLLAE